MKRSILTVLFVLFSLIISAKAQANHCEFQVSLYFQGLRAYTTYQVFKSTVDATANDCNVVNSHNQAFLLATTDAYGQLSFSFVEYGYGEFTYTVYSDGLEYRQVFSNVGYQTVPTAHQYCENQDSYLSIGQFARVPLANSSRTKIRLSAGITSSEVRTPIAQGRKVLVVEGPLCLDGITWWRVVYDYGEVSQITGWMAETDGEVFYLEPVAGEYAQIVYPALPNYASATTLPWMTINTLVRSNPSLVTSSVIGRVHVNEIVSVIGTNATGTWLQVSLPDGSIGWSCSQLLYSNVSQYPVAVTDDSSEICEI